MSEHILWALTVGAVAFAFLRLGWVLHRDRYLLRFPRRPTVGTRRRRFGR